MTTEILLAPIGTGKTEIALHRLVTTLDDQPFARIWVLVSGKRQEDAFRQRLAERDDQRRVYFNVEFFTFYQLYHYLLNAARQPPQKLDDSARYGLLRVILAELQSAGNLSLYGAIAQTPGFVRIIADFIYELKQNLIWSEKFTVEAKHNRKDIELAFIYRTYQQRLIQHHVVDREGEGWLALEVLRQEQHRNIGRDVDLLLVDGYDQFTPLQASLLMLLADRAHATLVTMTTVTGREQTIGRRFTRALEQLLEANVSSEPLFVNRISEFPPGVTEIRRPALRHLTDAIFRSGIPPRPAGDNVVLIEAPDPARETAVVLRRVKRLLLTTDCQPDDIVITLRDWQRYAGHFAAFGRTYELPLTMHRGEPVAQNPAIIMLLNLLSLYEGDFRRRDLLDALRSPYFDIPGLDAEQIELLERVSRTFMVIGGRESWLNAIVRSTKPFISGHDGDDESDEPLLNADDAANLHRRLAAFFDAVTPPERALLDDYIFWLDALIGVDEDANPDDDAGMPQDAVFSLHMPRQIKQQSASGVVERDLAALQELKRILRTLLSGRALLRSLGEQGDLDRAAFLVELKTAIGNAVVNRGAGRSGKILVTTVTDARGLPHKHVFIPGLSEGVFPAPLSEDPLYLDTERERLQRVGIPLETQDERAADDTLFYELISLARESLTLSRPTVQDGAPWIASHLWRGVTAVFTDSAEIIARNRIGVGAVVQAEDVASLEEAALATADHLNACPQVENASLYNWLLATHSDHWGHINRARQIEHRRSSRHHRHDRYSGRLSHPELITYAASQLSQQRHWSASQLNDYGICGFRFFAKRLLKLEALEEPEEGLDAAKLGTINHEILEHTYREIADLGLLIAPENLDRALDILHRIAHPVLANAPQKLGFRESAKWEQERVILVRRLEQLIRLDFSDESWIAKKIDASPRRAFKLETPFGRDGAPEVRIPIVVDGENELLLVQGYIDRLDRAGDGLIVVDYKSGSTPIPVDDMVLGRNFQMMLYLRAAQQILAGERIIGGLFWHIRRQQSSGVLLIDEDDKMIEQAEAFIGRYIAAGRKGDFSVRATKPDHGRCTHYCEYSQLCRMSSTHRYKL